MKTWTRLALAAALATAVGCGSDKSTPKPDGAAFPQLTDGGSTDGNVSTPDGGGTMNDAGMTGTDAPLALTLVDFVTGLVQKSTTATAVPTTIDDKKITDTADPTAFDKLLNTP
jgi:hypothetical protein